MRTHVVVATTLVRRIGGRPTMRIGNRIGPGPCWAGKQHHNFREPVVPTTVLTVELWTQSRSGIGS